MPRNDFDDFEDSADFPMNDGEESKPITFGELGVPSPFRFLWSLVLDPMIRLAKPR